MSGGSQLRKELGARITGALGDREFRRQRTKERYRRSEGMEPPLVAQLLVRVDTDRYGLVRLAGGIDVVADPVDEAYESAPDEALNEFQQMYRDRRRYPLASRSFKRLADAPRDVPFEWTASDTDQGTQAVEAFLDFVDVPVASWIGGRSTVAALHAAVDGTDEESADADAVRNVSVLDVLRGDAERAMQRLARYAAHPEDGIDSAEQVEAFRQWLTTLQPRPDLRTG